MLLYEPSPLMPIMRCATAAALISALIVCNDGQTAQEVTPPTQTPFRSSVDLVTLHVTVTDSSGKFLTDIEPSDVVVLENGRRQQLSLFQAGGLPLALALLLDTSASVRHGFRDVQEAAVRFLRQLQPHDMASVIGFGDTVRLLHGFTTDRQDLETAIREATAAGSTTFYNAVYVALNELDRAMARSAGQIPRRRVVVVFSDGDDTASLVEFEDLLNAVTRSDAVIYAIRMGPEDRAGEGYGGPGFVLRQLTNQTGGRAFFPPNRYGLRQVYEDIRTELSLQYALGFVSTEARMDGRFRRLSVQVLRAGAHARTRRGYVAPTNASRRR
jgi:Ca-activated chloride channel family protein